MIRKVTKNCPLCGCKLEGTTDLDNSQPEAYVNLTCKKCGSKTVKKEVL